MRINEIKETKEVIVRTEYIAEDGKKFNSEEECKKYEESALFMVSRQLKRLGGNKMLSEFDIYDEACGDCPIEIFKAETETDIENIRRYAYLRVAVNHKKVYENDVELPNITPGHEVIIHWNYDEDTCWAIGDGSINAMCDYIRSNITKLITPKESEKTENAEN